MDEFERRSRLVSLAYEVLRDMETPADDATLRAMFADLARAFFDKATSLANLEAAAPRERRKLRMVAYAAPMSGRSGKETVRSLPA